MDKIEKCLKELSKAIKNDPSYAWAWQSNLAMMAVDAGAPHKEANIRAADLMRHLFGVEMMPVLQKEFGY